MEDALSASTAGASESVTVVGNHGRWVVECPDCAGAQVACRTDRRFMCNECANITIGGHWRPVAWPAEATAIDAELDKRPRQNQNWLPGESVKQLRSETIAAGVVPRDPGRHGKDWQGHTHTWPDERAGHVSCTECGLTVPAHLLDREA